MSSLRGGVVASVSRRLAFGAVAFSRVAFAQPGADPSAPPLPDPKVHQGRTFEANTGIVFASESGVGNGATIGFALGLGGWVTPHLALTLRIVGIPLGGSHENFAYVGPSLQYWASDHVWLGAGIGLGWIGGSGEGTIDSNAGVGLDVRAGYSFEATATSAFNVSVEFTPAHFTSLDFGNGAEIMLTGVALLIGYQFL